MIIWVSGFRRMDVAKNGVHVSEDVVEEGKKD